eukprot:TRINITY_DN11725_c0_g1_i3.p1 TRINITY_DN11725_c0_g1~~TRINITY_DN11725_c0_g1_i3.p1  ORF type:complete len:210 (+),score=40.79 TRINITY_DN11725_c0_g1_i3:99-728(+)
MRALVASFFDASASAHGESSFIAAGNASDASQASRADDHSSGSSFFRVPFALRLHHELSGEDAANAVLLRRARVAVTPEEMQRGLMFRRSLSEDEGMLFIFGEPRQGSMWMKNTSVPLDVGWFTKDGVLREVQALVPYDLTSRRSLRKDISYALEVPQGFFGKHKLAPGKAAIYGNELQAALLESLKTGTGIRRGKHGEEMRQFLSQTA